MLEEFSNLDTYGGNMGAVNQPVDIQQLAIATWNYIKDKGFSVPKGLDVIFGDRIEVGSLIPDSYEPLVIGILSSKLSQYVEENLGAKTLDGIAGSLSIEIIQGAYVQLLQTMGVPQSEIDNATAEQAMDNLQYIPLYFLSASGPTAGVGRQFLNDKLSGFIKNGMYSALEAAGLIPPPKPGTVADWLPGINKAADEVVDSADLKQYETPDAARAAIWPSLERHMVAKYPQFINKPFMSFIILNAHQRLINKLESHYSYDFAWDYDPARGVVVGARKPFSPAGGGNGAGAGSIPILPLALAAGAVALLVFKK